MLSLINHFKYIFILVAAIFFIFILLYLSQNFNYNQLFKFNIINSLFIIFNNKHKTYLCFMIIILADIRFAYINYKICSF